MDKSIIRMTSAARLQWLGDNWDEHYIANCVGSQRLVAYLQEPGETLRWTVDGDGEAGPRVVIEVRKGGNRTGVPKSAKTWRYTITGPTWEVQVRAVWVDGQLMTPLATHCRVTKVVPNNQEARRDYNAWLQSLALI
jgi:hypothetical protein